VTETAALNMLFGATLVTFGVLASALADRIRGIRLAREAAPRESRRVAEPLRVIESESVELLPSLPKPERSRAPRSETKMQTAADDVIAALVAAGYKKPIATEATWGCSAADRETIEGWTRAALRRCAQGGVS